MNNTLYIHAIENKNGLSEMATLSIFYTRVIPNIVINTNNCNILLFYNKLLLKYILLINIINYLNIINSKIIDTQERKKEKKERRNIVLSKNQPVNIVKEKIIFFLKKDVLNNWNCLNGLNFNLNFIFGGTYWRYVLESFLGYVSKSFCLWRCYHEW